MRGARFPEEPMDVLILETTRGDHARRTVSPAKRGTPLRRGDHCGVCTRRQCPGSALRAGENAGDPCDDLPVSEQGLIKECPCISEA